MDKRQKQYLLRLMKEAAGLDERQRSVSEDISQELNTESFHVSYIPLTCGRDRVVVYKKSRRRRGHMDLSLATNPVTVVGFHKTSKVDAYLYKKELNEKWVA